MSHSTFFLFRLLLPIALFFSFHTQTTAQALANFNVKTVGNTTPLGMYYAEYLPPGFSSSTTTCGYPMMIVLHGIGEKGPNDGSQLSKVTVHGPAKHIKNGHDMCFTVNGKEECFVVIAPQLDVGNWTPAGIKAFYDDVMADPAVGPKIDPNRVYLTGLSLGGIGVYWHMINPVHNNPNVFAAFAPVAGNASTTIGCSFTNLNVPMWAFHGDKDGTVPYSQDLALYNNILGCTTPAPSTEFKFTTYPNVGHNSWDRAYNTGHTYHNPNLYEWLLTKTLPNTTNSCPNLSAINLNKSVFCEGEVLYAHSTQSGINDYYWEMDGDSVSVDSLLTLVTSTIGSHDLKLVSSNCDCILDTTVSFSVIAAATVPVITYDSVELTSTAASTYQWYLNDTSIAGATAQTHVPILNGDYTVVTGDANNCNATSAAYVVLNLGVSPTDPTNDFVVYPNPSEGKINIQLWMQKNANALVRVVDLRGVKLLEKSFNTLRPGNNTLALDLSTIHFKGPVLVIISTDGKTRTDRIVLE
jgi:hypothetical protein